MEYVVKFSSNADRDYDKHILAGNRPLIEKIESLKTLMAKDPYGRFNRKGRPKKLIHDGEKVYSRKIDRRHRVIYKINEKEKKVIVAAVLGHYGDK